MHGGIAVIGIRRRIGLEIFAAGVGTTRGIGLGGDG